MDDCRPSILDEGILLYEAEGLAAAEGGVATGPAMPPAAPRAAPEPK